MVLIVAMVVTMSMVARRNPSRKRHHSIKAPSARAAAHSCRGLIDVRLPQLPHIHKDISHVPNRPILRSGSFDVVVVTPVDGHRNGYRRYDLSRHQGACGKEG